MPEPTRQYIFTEGQVRFAFAAVNIGMVVLLVAVLLLISARPQGRFSRVDDGQFRRTLAASTEQLRGYRQLENGNVQLDIYRAMELVAARGAADPFTATEVAQEVPTGEAETAGQVDGASVYGACAACHQASGEGVPGAFPPLSGHAAELYFADPAYLAQVVLFGLQGPIIVEGTTYGGMMPAWQQYSDEEIAALLNYILTSWENDDLVDEDEPYEPSFIAEVRADSLTPQEVHERRLELDLE